MEGWHTALFVRDSEEQPPYLGRALYIYTGRCFRKNAIAPGKQVCFNRQEKAYRRPHALHSVSCAPTCGQG